MMADQEVDALGAAMRDASAREIGSEGTEALCDRKLDTARFTREQLFSARMAAADWCADTMKQLIARGALGMGYGPENIGSDAEPDGAREMLREMYALLSRMLMVESGSQAMGEAFPPRK